MAYFDKNAFNMFNLKLVGAGRDASQHNTQESKNESLSNKIRDFPKYWGKDHEWQICFERFTAIASLQKVDDLLEEDQDHKFKFNIDPDY